MLLLLLAQACKEPDEGTIRRARGGRHDEDTAADADTDTDTDSDTDSDSDTDTDTDTDADIPGPLTGIDISHWNAVSDWGAVKRAGIYYSNAKATEGTYYTDDTFWDSNDGARGRGLLSGAYHFAIPDDSSGAEQAEFFVDNGGGWTADGQTLPGTLDIEYNPYGDTCYDLSNSAMAAWIRDFNDTYKDLTGRYPMVYTTANWWDSCVGSDAFGSVNPLWVAHYGASSPSLPDGWSTYVFWQYTSEGSVDGIDGDVDMNVYQGSLNELIAFADDG